MCGGGGSRRSRTSRSRSSNSNRSRQQETGGVPAPEEDDPDDRCIFTEITELEATNQDVLEEINIGDIFPVEIRDNRPCVVDFDDQIVGSILGDLAGLLERCIEEGHNYRAEIITIDRRDCSVQVTNKCPIEADTMLASPNPDVLTDIQREMNSTYRFVKRVSA